MKTIRFGIEIETVGATRMTIAQAIQGVVGGVAYHDGASARVNHARGRSWKVVPDGSLSGSTSGEIVSPILCYEDIEQLQEIIRAARRAGARADASCGIHYARAVVMRSRSGKPANSDPATSANCA